MLLNLDPWCKYILEKSHELLKDHDKISVYELYEFMGGDAQTQIKQVTLRKKLNELTALNLLMCIPGRGRTPSYYFLPKHPVAHNYREILKHYMKHIHNCEGTFYLTEVNRTTCLNTVDKEVLSSIVEEIKSENNND